MQKRTLFDHFKGKLRANMCVFKILEFWKNFAIFGPMVAILSFQIQVLGVGTKNFARQKLLAAQFDSQRSKIKQKMDRN